MDRTKMPRWRPADRLRAVSIGLAIHNARLLVVQVLSDAGRLEGWRPPGDGARFGEPAREALAREIREDLGCEISIDGSPAIFENIYEHEGATGHEIVFAFPIALLDSGLCQRVRFKMREDSGTSHWAEWIALSRFRSGEHVLFPAGVLERLAYI